MRKFRDKRVEKQSTFQVTTRNSLEISKSTKTRRNSFALNSMMRDLHKEVDSTLHALHASKNM